MGDDERGSPRRCVEVGGGGVSNLRGETERGAERSRGSAIFKPKGITHKTRKRNKAERHRGGTETKCKSK